MPNGVMNVRAACESVRPGRTHTEGYPRSHATTMGQYATCTCMHKVSGLWRGNVDTHAYVYAGSWLGIRASWTHTHAWGSAFPRHTLECSVWAVGRMRACVISRNIVVNPQWYELTCIAHSAQVVKSC